MPGGDRAMLLERASGMRPLLQAHAAETDSLRRLPDAVVSALHETGLCRLMVPRRLGGFQTNVRTYIDVIAELGRGCGATAWVASLINVCAWLAGTFPERAQRDVWAGNAEAWIAGSLAPLGAATPVDGGWRVTGRWPWASGCLHAQWAACGMTVRDPSGQVVNLGLSLMPMDQLTIEDTWHMAGLHGTGSNTIVGQDVFVPEYRFLPYPPAFSGAYRTEHADEQVYRSAFIPITVLILAGSQLGMARAALDYVIEHAGARGITHTNFKTQRESSGFQILLADAAMKIETARLHASRAADEIDEHAERGTYPDVTARARMRADTALTARNCREAIDLLISAHGTSSLSDTHPMQRLWRDIQVASHHAVTEWQVNLEIYGRALLGLENVTHLI
jgi:alkylation response protein AidB-like acyl-CoA dehydrogenase